MTRRIKSLARDENGASLIEMGLALPILSSLLIGMVDISRAYSAKLQLEQAAYRAIEKVQQYNTTASTYDTLKSEASAAARASGFASATDSDVTIDFWLECNGARAADYNSVCPGSQTYARWVTIDIQGTFTPMFASRRWPGANSNGTFTLHGKAGLRTQ
ncbi:MAG TPA: TadE/TadG family type IV pilus assembly protein [Sphingomicrobium sp.]|nr:TadE/TadG family type IV pilus assembly protein [Sphingomicrobium sp.]